jgi:hypothetical protein
MPPLSGTTLSMNTQSPELVQAAPRQESVLATLRERIVAAMSMRAECAMLNRGAQIAAAVRMLVDIIRKMEMHQYKKRWIYRPLGPALGGAAESPGAAAPGRSK